MESNTTNGGDEGSACSHASASSAPPSRRSRIALACHRCKRRKQRCDGSHPVCRSCQKAKTECVYERAMRPRYPGGKTLYIQALEERIAFLEAHMPEYAEDHMDPARSSGIRQQEQELQTPPFEFHSDEENSTLVDGVAYLSLCASGTTDTAPEPFYLGPSPGATIARMIPSSIFRPTRRSTIHSMQVQVNLVRPTLPCHRSPGLTHPSSDIEPSAAKKPQITEGPLSGNFGDYPPRHVAQSLFTVFFDRLHTRWPILDRQLYQMVFEEQYSRKVLPTEQKSILHLIYAISSSFLQLTKKNCEVDPERHFAAALVPMDHILEAHNLATQQFLVLLALYGKRHPYGAGSWSQVRYAVTLCIELGLHRKRSERPSMAKISPRDSEIRRRVFWACYCLDRETSSLLGRSPAISDRDINCELPSDSVDFRTLASRETPENKDQDWSNIRPFIHIIKLRQLQSKIHQTVFRVDKDILGSLSGDRTKLDAKIATISAELDEWARTIPVPPQIATSITWMYEPEGAYHGQDSTEFFHLQYHKTVLSLFTPLVPALSATEPRFVSAARSAARVCMAYKRLSQQKTLSYTLVALHSCFIAGLTLAYCLWRNMALFTYDALEATRACSQCLTIFGEKWPSTVKYRDIFDSLSGSLLRAVVDGGRANRRDPEGDAGSTTPRSRDSGSRLPHPLDMPLLPQHNGLVKDTTALDSTCAIVDTAGITCEVDRAVQPGDYDDGVQAASDPSDEGIEGKCRETMFMDVFKEAFMEVDEETPSGWYGWRMFSEMVHGSVPQGYEVMLPQSERLRPQTLEVGSCMEWTDCGGGQYDTPQMNTEKYQSG